MALEDYDERCVLLALLRIRPGRLSWTDITSEVIRAGSALAAWDRLTDDGSLTPPDYEADLRAAMVELSDWEHRGLKLLTALDADYPVQLLDIHQAPPFVFYRGTVVESDIGVSIVGSRQASPSGLSVARSAARELVSMGLTVVSGLAAGIDAQAHTEALERGGRTVAVIGTGINRMYPSENRKLADEIVANRGLIISQFFPDAPPTKSSFPMRNAVMSGYGIATFVAEAGETSGSRIQARLAVEHGRPVILSRAVTEQTEWGRRLVGGPSVYVANGTGDFRQALEVIQEQDTQLRSLTGQVPAFA